MPPLTTVAPVKPLLAPASVSVPGPVLAKVPVPSMTPPKVRLVALSSTWNAPVPPAASVNFLLVVAVLPVNSRVPVSPPVLPRLTARALLPSGPAALSLLIVATLNVPAWMRTWPVKVLELLTVTVPAPVLVRPVRPVIAPPSRM